MEVGSERAKIVGLFLPDAAASLGLEAASTGWRDRSTNQEAASSGADDAKTSNPPSLRGRIAIYADGPFERLSTSWRSVPPVSQWFIFLRAVGSAFVKEWLDGC